MFWSLLFWVIDWKYWWLDWLVMGYICMDGKLSLFLSDLRLMMTWWPYWCLKSGSLSMSWMMSSMKTCCALRKWMSIPNKLTAYLEMSRITPCRSVRMWITWKLFSRGWVLIVDLNTILFLLFRCELVRMFTSDEFMSSLPFSSSISTWFSISKMYPFLHFPNCSLLLLK